jgi:GNAT superfamily N-acetyltransferase
MDSKTKIHATRADAAKVVIRPAVSADGAACGKICFAAFSAINDKHGFPCDFPSVDAAIGLMTMMFSIPGFYAVVAEVDGRIVGSNVLDERSVIRGVGPISIDLDVQNKGLGRALMEAAMMRVRERGAAGVRLVQAAFHSRSFSLYASMGFDVREPLTCLQGQIKTERSQAGYSARMAVREDLPACNALSHRVHGFDRSGELEQAIEAGTATIVERDGRITAYSVHLGFFGHSVAEANVDLQVLIASAESIAGPGLLVPSRNAALLRWCLASGLRVVQPMTLMSTGLYNEPAGAWLPSILF